MISEFPLFVFTLFTGLAAGAYMAAALFPQPVAENGAGKASRSWLFPLVCLVLVGIGALGALFHLQHPERVLNALMNPAAGITQEAYCSMLLGVVAFVEVVLGAAGKRQPQWLRIVGGLVGLLLAVITGYAYFINLGVPAWNSPLSILLFVASDAAMGFALWAVFAKGLYEKPAFRITFLVVQALLAVALVGECASFAALGLDVVLLVAGLVIAPIACAVLAFMAKGPKAPSMAVVILVCAIIGVALARYAFYAACPF